MIWRSIVGKLWMTILFLVSLVLLTLTVLLLQFFDNYYTEEAEQKLTRLASQISTIMETYDDRDNALHTSWEVMDSHSAKALILNHSGDAWQSPNKKKSPRLSYAVITDDPVLSKVLKKGERAKKIGYFPVEGPHKVMRKKVFVIGMPIQLGNHRGAVFIYQTLEAIKHTSDEAKKIIYFSAAIAIILTTIFAFFLSTRITAPLRKLQKAVTEVEKGNFHYKIPIVSRDEIGQLAFAFNRMGKHLASNIHALNQEKEQISGVLNSMADGVMMLDRDGYIIVSNPPAEHFLYSWRQSQEDQTSAHLPKAIHSLYQKMLASADEQMGDIDVSDRSWAIVMTPLYNQSVIRGAVVVLRDMTEERRLNKLRQDFIANVSHELRTPVSMLRGYSEAIVDDIASSEQEKQEVAQIIYEESLRMERLVNELLDLARMESGRIQLYQSFIDISPYFDRIVKKFSGIADEAKVNLHLDMSITDQAQYYFDPDRIEQVMTNLIHNAIRHSHTDSQVIIHVQSLAEGLLVKVSDYGSGIPESDIPYVFERFYKADKARTRGVSGTGLGLSIAKNLVEAHNGHMSVYSRQGEGATFQFTIPADDEQSNK